MSDSTQNYNPNLPWWIPFWVLSMEKGDLAGTFVGSILYGTHITPHLRVCPPVPILFVRFIQGIVIVLFFQCLATLFNSAHRRGEDIKWGLVSYTMIMFLLVTAFTAMNLNTGSVSFIDHREFEADWGGPIGYQRSIPTVDDIVPNVVFLLSYWLADGLLVSSPFDVAQVSNAGPSFSSIVATQSTP